MFALGRSLRRCSICLGDNARNIDPFRQFHKWPPIVAVQQNGAQFPDQWIPWIRSGALIVECITGHYRTKIKGASRMYLILEGSGTFTINGTKETAGQYDLFIISDGDVYEYEGAMKLFECNVPATDAGNEENLS